MTDDRFTSVPIGLASFDTADQILRAFEIGLVNRQEARVLLGLDDERLTLARGLSGTGVQRTVNDAVA